MYIRIHYVYMMYILQGWVEMRDSTTIHTTTESYFSNQLQGWVEMRDSTTIHTTTESYFSNQLQGWVEMRDSTTKRAYFYDEATGA